MIEDSNVVKFAAYAKSDNTDIVKIETSEADSAVVLATALNGLKDYLKIRIAAGDYDLMDIPFLMAAVSSQLIKEMTEK